MPGRSTTAPPDPNPASLRRESAVGGEAPLRVAHVLAPAPHGGLERVVHGLAVGQRARGYAVHVLAVLGPDEARHPFLDAVEADGVHAIPVRVGSREYLRERRLVEVICRRLAVDVLHTHGYRPDLLHRATARRLGVPAVTTLHGFTGGGLRNRTYEFLQRRSCRRFDAVVAVSHPLAERVRTVGADPGRIHCVPNGWRRSSRPLARDDARAELRMSGDRFHVGWVGRLSHEKGFDVLVEALPALADLPIAVSVLGDGPERASLAARAEVLGLSGRIHWHGTVPDASRFFPAFDLFVLSSRTEGTPMVVLEAMDAEIPIVAARVGGIPHMLSPSEALLVPPGDQAALAAAIRGAHADRGAARARAASARHRVSSQFGFAPWIARYDAIYRDVLRYSSRGRSCSSSSPAP